MAVNILEKSLDYFLSDIMHNFKHLGVWKDMMENSIRICQKLGTQHKLLVNKEINPTVVLLKPTEYTLQHFQFGFLPMTFVLATSKEDLLNFALSETGILENNTFANYSVPFDPSEIIKLERERKGLSLSIYWSLACLTASKEDIPEFELVSGYLLDELNDGDIKQVVDNWPLYPFSDDAFQYVQLMVRNSPSIAVRDSNRQLVAWGFMHNDGTVGNLFVEEKNRKRGLGSFVLAELARKLFDTNGYAISTVEWDNKESLNLHKKCGFKVASDLSYNIVYSKLKH